MASERFQRQIDQQLDEAEAALSRYDWEAVRQAALAVLAIDPDNADGQTFLATVERALSGSSAPPPTDQPGATTTPVPTPIQPTSFANGRYQVKRFLGEGGKKKVYLAHDTTLDREVAFALIKTEGLDDTSRTRIQREAQAMGRLGSHAHIVTVFDLGEEQGQPYMVTELMGGGDVEGTIEAAEDHRLPLEQAIKIAQETCWGMEFAHSRGIVHRDLKPGNVWITSDGIAKIGDLGLAVALDRSRLTTEGMMVGTVSYMPPEQAMGGEVTPRSDLYSLGAMLYEMVTGRPPFLGDDSVAIIGQHINTPPVAPTWHNSECPRALDALILRLLAKDPSERPESATDVLSALEGVDLAETAVVREHSLQDETHALDSLAGGVFVGRHREMGDLKAALEDALSGRGRLVTLVGEPGIGKTRTAQELATYAGLRGAQVLWGRCYEEQGVPPYWPWVQAIRSYVRERDPEQLRSEMGAGAADIAEVVSDVRERLSDLQPPPETESPEQARFRLFDSISAFLKTASQKQPLVLVLDDLHWADGPSLLLLQFAASELGSGGGRLLMVGTYRDVELSRQHPLAETLGQLTRERLFQRVVLRGLTETDVERFIEITTGVAPPLGLVQSVYTQTEGNPLFVTEVVRLLVQEGDLTPERIAQRDSWTVRIPEGVREVIGRRLNRLSPRCNETLTIASVIGREFSLDQVKPMVDDISEDRLLELLEEALAARVIEELPRAAGQYQFTHALIQETLTQELTLTRRVRLHARIAESLEDLYGDNAEAHAAELAHHFAEAEAVRGTEKLIRYCMIAGERAVATYGWEEAASHFERALAAKEAQPMDADKAELLFGLGRARIATNLDRVNVREVMASLELAFDYFVQAGSGPRAVAVAETWTPSSAKRAMLPIWEKALELAQPGSSQAGRLLCKKGNALGDSLGSYASAQEAFDASLAIATRLGDTSLEVEVLGEASHVDFRHLRGSQSLEKALRAIALSDEVDAPYAKVRANSVAALNLLLNEGDAQPALQHIERSSSLAQTLRNRTLLSISNRHRCDSMYMLGNLDAARDFADRGLAIDPLDSTTLGSAVLFAYETGDYEEGEHYLRRSVDLMHASEPGATSTYVCPATLIPYISRIIEGPLLFDVARQAAEVVLSFPSVAPQIKVLVHMGLGLIALWEGDRETVAASYSHLGVASGTMALTVTSTVDRIMGILAGGLDNCDQATGHFEDALAFCRKAGYRPELAWTCCDYADTLRGRDAEGDRAKAISLLDESLAISSELGMRPLMERVLSRREILKA